MNLKNSGKISRVVIILYLTVLFFQLSRSTNNVSPENVAPSSELDVDSPFRMNKINVVWQKAKRTLDQKRLLDLYAELAVQDRLEIDWKKQKAEHKDDDGAQEAVLRKKFLKILSEFGLGNIEIPTVAPAAVNRVSSQAANEADDPDRAAFEATLSKDAKLAKLWKKAELTGFSGEELKGLKTEFEHHRLKVDEYEQLKNDIYHLEAAMSDNSIDPNGKGLGDWDGVSLKGKHSELKKIYRDVLKSYEALSERTAAQVSPDSLFDDPRVAELWQMAIKSNLSEAELSSFKAELGHFQKRIAKHEFFQKQAEIVRVGMRGQDKPTEDYPPEYRDLELKAREHGAKVKKWYMELKSRILQTQQSHSEL